MFNIYDLRMVAILSRGGSEPQKRYKADEDHSSKGLVGNKAIFSLVTTHNKKRKLKSVFHVFSAVRDRFSTQTCTSESVLLVSFLAYVYRNNSLVSVSIYLPRSAFLQTNCAVCKVANSLRIFFFSVDFQICFSIMKWQPSVQRLWKCKFHRKYMYVVTRLVFTGNCPLHRTGEIVNEAIFFLNLTVLYHEVTGPSCCRATISTNKLQTSFLT